MKQKYAFLDRDGALIYEPPEDETVSGEVPYQIDSLEKLKVLPGVLAGLKALVESGYKLVMVSNQDYLGRTVFPRSDFERPQQRFLQILREEGVEFEDVFVCPHGADDGCLCRKPQIGLVEEFFERNDVDMENSFMYGDRGSDEAFARNLGIRFVKVKTNNEFNLKLLI